MLLWSDNNQIMLHLACRTCVHTINDSRTFVEVAVVEHTVDRSNIDDG